MEVELAQLALLKASADDLLLQSGNLRHLEYTRPNDTTDPKLRQFGFENQKNLLSQLPSRLDIIRQANSSSFVNQATHDLQEVLSKLSITPKAGTTKATSDMIDHWYLQLNGLTNDLRQAHHAALRKAQALYRFGNGLNLVILLCAISLLIYQLWLQYRKNKAFSLQVEALYDEARTDHLTGLNNRRGWEEAVGKMQSQLQRAKSMGKEVHAAVAILDIDHFKQYNNTFGHQKGDQRLISFANMLSNHFRPIDIIARIGGEELGVIFPHCSGESAKRIIERVQSTNREIDDEIAIAFSAGVAEIDPGHSMANTIAIADQALYQAKMQGRNRVVSVQPDAKTLTSLVHID